MSKDVKRASLDERAKAGGFDDKSALLAKEKERKRLATVNNEFARRLGDVASSQYGVVWTRGLHTGVPVAEPAAGVALDASLDTLEVKAKHLVATALGVLAVVNAQENVGTGLAVDWGPRGGSARRECYL